MCVLGDQFCLTLCNLVDYSLPGSSVHGILQARILKWVAIPFPGVTHHDMSLNPLPRTAVEPLAKVAPRGRSSTGSSRPRDWAWVSCIARRFFTIWATREALTLATFLAHTYLFSERSPGKSPHPSSPPLLKNTLAIPAAWDKSELYVIYTLIYTYVKLYKVYTQRFTQMYTHTFIQINL